MNPSTVTLVRRLIRKGWGVRDITVVSHATREEVKEMKRQMQGPLRRNRSKPDPARQARRMLREGYDIHAVRAVFGNII